MSLKFNCSNPACRRRIEVEDALAGTEIPCPACAATLRVPASHDIRFSCVNKDCAQHIVVDVSEAGRAIKCPACGRPQRVPGDPPKPLVPVSEQPAKAVQKTGGLRSRGQPARRFAHEDQVVVWFVVAAVVGMVGFGLAKVSTLWMQPGFPPGKDAVFGMPLNQVVVVLGLVECGVAGLCACIASLRLAALLLLWYSINWWVYRLGQFWLAQQETVPALGAFGEMLGLRAVTTDRMMMGFVSIVALGAVTMAWREGAIQRPKETGKGVQQRPT